jgi:signal transduction histidine kinase
MILLCRQIDALAEDGGPAAGGGAGPERPQPPLGELRKRAEAAVAELRTIARGLRPPVLDDLGLVASLGQLVGEAERRGAFQASLGVDGVERRLPSAIELALFRIAQEGLANAEKHAAAVHVAVGLDFEPGGVRLLVKDDGVGFDGGTSPSPGGSLGLPGMAERARLVGGSLAVYASEGAGCTIDVWVPTTD